MHEIMRILIACESSGAGEMGVADLKRAGFPPRAQVVVLSVADVLMPPTVSAPLGSSAPARAARKHAERAVEEAQRAAAQARHRIVAAFPQWDVHVEVCADSPAWAIIKKADDWCPAVVVVGSHHRSALGRFMLGSVSHKVLSEAHCSVRIARQTAIERDQPPRLLIGFDGSANAKAAVEAVARRCWPPGTQAHVVSVLDAMLLSSTQS